jgi:hypothetical protein
MGTLFRKTNDPVEIEQLIDQEVEFEDCNFLQDPISVYQQILETVKKYSSVAI